MTGHTQDPPSPSGSSAEPETPLVVLEYPSFQDFLHSCASRISVEGLLLEVEPRERVGSPLRFELRIRDGFCLLRGEGEVVRVHDPLPTSSELAGLAVRFTSLDEASSKLLPVILGHYHQRGIPLLDWNAEASGVEIEVRAEEAADEAATDVTLDDLWEEFEVVAGLETGQLKGDESPAGAAPESLLVEAEKLADGIDLGEPAEVSDPTSATVESEASDAEIVEPEPSRETQPDTDDAVAGGQSAGEPETAADEERAAMQDDALDLAGVLPTAPGGAAVAGEDLELPPEEEDGPEETLTRPWWRRRELWLFLLMAFLGILVGIAVYVKFVQGGDWPWRSESDRGQPSSSQAAAADGETDPMVPETIAAFDFERPTGLVEEGQVMQAETAGANEVVPKESARQELGQASPQSRALVSERPSARQAADVALTGVDRITWQESQDQTVLTLWGDGPFDTDQLVVFRLDTGTPRQVVKILGVSRPFSERNLSVGTSHVSTIRTGLHAGKVGQELHVVADLEDSAVRMRRLEPEGSQLHVYFSRL